MKRLWMLLWAFSILIIMTGDGCSNSKQIKYEQVKLNPDERFKVGTVSLSELNEKSIRLFRNKIIFKMGEVDLAEVNSLLHSLGSPIKISDNILSTSALRYDLNAMLGCWVEIDYKSESVGCFVPPEKWTIWETKEPQKASEAIEKEK